jgi:hypothetical protein
MPQRDDPNRANRILPSHRFVHSLGAPLAHVKGTVVTVFAGPGNHHGANHQHFTLSVSTVVSLEGANFSPETLVGQTIFVAVRFGDNEGLDSEIPGLAENTPIEVQGEYVSSAAAYPTQDNDGNPALHFTHHPVGFVLYEGHYYS